MLRCRFFAECGGSSSTSSGGSSVAAAAAVVVVAAAALVVVAAAAALVEVAAAAAAVVVVVSAELRLRQSRDPIYSSFVFATSHSNQRMLRSSYERSKFPGSWENIYAKTNSMELYRNFKAS